MNSYRPAPSFELMTITPERTTVRADLFTHQMQLCPAGRKTAVSQAKSSHFFHQTSVLDGPKKWKKVRPEVVAPE